MTMIAGFTFERFGLLAADSRCRWQDPDGSVRYSDSPPDVFVEHPGGFATGGGDVHVTLEVLAHMAPAPSLPLGAHLDRLRLAMERAVAASEREGVGSRVVVLNAGHSGPELGFVTETGAVRRVEHGQLLFMPPRPLKSEELPGPFRRLNDAAAAVARGEASTLDTVRSVAGAFAEAAERSLVLSGGVTIGVIEDAPGQRLSMGMFNIEHAGRFACESDERISECVEVLP